VALPSQIVEQRPDVRAAQSNLHAAGALVGVAIANRIPLFNLSGNIGRTSGEIGNLFNPTPQFLFWTVAGSVAQTIFDGFTLEQRQRAAEAGWEQAAEQYRSTVVTAFQNVADVLQAIELDARSRDKAIAALSAAKENLCLTVAGFVGYNGMGNPEDYRNLSGISSDDAQLKARIAQNFGGWWRRVCTPDSTLKGKLSKESKDKKDAPSGIDVLRNGGQDCAGAQSDPRGDVQARLDFIPQLSGSGSNSRKLASRPAASPVKSSTS
jgi:outer membrane protein TolC